jgi:hypothetical protein
VSVSSAGPVVRDERLSCVNAERLFRLREDFASVSPFERHRNSSEGQSFARVRNKRASARPSLRASPWKALSALVLFAPGMPTTLEACTPFGRAHEAWAERHPHPQKPRFTRERDSG